MNISKSPLSDFLSKNKNEYYIDGNLDKDYGFLPSQIPCKSLPDYFSPWNLYADKIPQLFFEKDPQTILKQMPLLSVNNLEDKDLKYAAIVLSLLAHAYWRFGENYFSTRMSQIPVELPECILQPWTEVNRRLGRFNDSVKLPYQSAFDLFLNNWKFKSNEFIKSDNTYDLDDVIIENIEPLVPAFGNQAERIFNMSFVEMHAYASKMVSIVCELQEAILTDQEQTIIQSLENLTNLVHFCSRAFRKISPFAKSNLYCDPVLWGKTIAIFGVPHDSFPQGGTSGTGTPVMFLLDALLERKKYQSHYGKYVVEEGIPKIPAYLIDFVKAVEAVSLKQYLNDKQNTSSHQLLFNAYNTFVSSYAGEDGFLGIHIGKIMNYLATGTLVGRNESTSGHERFIYKKTWENVAKDLEHSRMERDIEFPGIVIKDALAACKTNTENSFTAMEIARHRNKDDLWVILDHKVYDLTAFLKNHLGGTQLIRAYAGNDASRFFAYVQNHKKVNKEKYLIGSVAAAVVSNENKEIYQNWKMLLENSLLIQGIMSIQYDHEFTSEPNDKAELYSIVSYGHSHYHFVKEHLPKMMDNIKNIAVLLQPELAEEFTQVTSTNSFREKISLEYCRILPDTINDDEILEKMQQFKNKDQHLTNEIIESAIAAMEKLVHNKSQDESTPFLKSIQKQIFIYII